MTRRAQAITAVALLGACSQPAPPPATVPAERAPFTPEQNPPEWADEPPTTVAATTTTAPPAAVAPTTAATAPAGPSRVPAPVASAVSTVGAGGAAATARVSWYGPESGSRTASGEAFTGADLTFAHKTMAFGTLVRFCRAGACVVARCNDRGPFVGGRTFDLSRAAFAAIAPLSAGVATVTWEAA